LLAGEDLFGCGWEPEVFIDIFNLEDLLKWRVGKAGALASERS
jgi:hypothetical protein